MVTLIYTRTSLREQVDRVIAKGRRIGHGDFPYRWGRFCQIMIDTRLDSGKYLAKHLETFMVRKGIAYLKEVKTPRKRKNASPGRAWEPMVLAPSA